MITKARTAAVAAMAIIAIAAITSAAFAADTPQTSAATILRDSGIKGGLVVVLGTPDGQLAAALHASDAYTVQTLDTDAAAIKKARAAIRSAGLYGPVSVEQFAGDSLPYADNLVNLVVAADLGRVPMAEVMRVLAPNGAAWIAGKVTRKPRPKTIDEWTHFLHDAGNNAVADDTQVGLPRRMQWQAGPLWLRSHETPSGVEAMVVGGGRMFYLLDEGLIGIVDQRLPERWAIICRDAFNGKQLWQIPIGQWGWSAWSYNRLAGKDLTTLRGLRTDVPAENQRRLVAAGDRLLATLTYDGPLSILDAANGKVLATIADTAPARQIAAADGVAVAYTSKPDLDEAAKRRGKAKPAASNAACLTGVDIQSGKVLWRKNTSPISGVSLAIDAGRVIWQTGGDTHCLALKTGESLWSVKVPAAATLVAAEGSVVLRRGKSIEVLDAATGKQLWKTEDAASMWGQDLFVIDGVVWPGIQAVKDDRGSPKASTKPGGRSGGPDNARTVGFDLRTGKQTDPIFAADMLSPEHHHRCYRNKATDRYLIGSMEGAEFLDLRGSASGQNNFVRGSCMMGMVPCNGMLYAPADQCFCQPGGKLLGMTALLPASNDTPTTPDDQRLTRGPAYGTKLDAATATPEDWPTFRHDAARHGSTPAKVPTDLGQAWHVKLGAGLTAPVVVGGRAYAAASDTHTVYALELATGKRLWTFTAGGRIDSAPTVFRGMVLFGSADGTVYCLRASDGALAWRFLAAPTDRRIVAFDQVESAWPVHGSVLIRKGLAYVAAGRSTYLDGGIRFWALEPVSGAIRHKATLYGPQPDGKDVERDVAFFVRGANSDVLVSEGDAIFMRQKRLSLSLKPREAEPLSSKGEADVGMHVFSTAGLLDGSWYNRTFWMYSKRWPGFQLANQAPKSGQLLCIDGQNTYGVKMFYRRNVHSPMFFPGREGYLIFADHNTTEPQIVGEPGARKPLAWLPQSDYDRAARKNTVIRKLDSLAFGLDKMIGYTRADPPVWAIWQPVRARAMVKADGTLFIAGPPDVFNEKDPYAGFEGRAGAKLVAISASDGKRIAGVNLPCPPAFDGMIATPGRVLIALTDGSLVCLAGSQ